MMDKAIIFVDENIPLLKDSLENDLKVTTFNGRELTNKILVDSECSILIVRSTTQVNEELLKNTNIKFVGTATSGKEHIDTAYLNMCNIEFATAIGTNANSVAEYVVYCMLKWAKEKSIDLRTKKLGIIGFGHIGRKVAYYGHHLGLKVLVNDPPLMNKEFDFPSECEYCVLRTLLEESDIVTNHIPLQFTGPFPTYNLLNGLNLKYMRGENLFINSSRGKIVNEDDLLKIAKKKEIDTCIDVWADEPDFNVELAKHSMLISAHTAGYSRYAKLKGSQLMLFNIEAIQRSLLNREILNSSFRDRIIYEPSELSDHERVFELLKENRNFEFDDEQMRKLFVLSPEERKAEFDTIRKNYPERWETLAPPINYYGKH